MRDRFVIFFSAAPLSRIKETRGTENDIAALLVVTSSEIPPVFVLL